METTEPIYMIRKPYESPLALDLYWLASHFAPTQGSQKGSWDRNLSGIWAGIQYYVDKHWADCLAYNI